MGTHKQTHTHTHTHTQTQPHTHLAITNDVLIRHELLRYDGVQEPLEVPALQALLEGQPVADVAEVYVLRGG